MSSLKDAFAAFDQKDRDMSPYLSILPGESVNIKRVKGGSVVMKADQQGVEKPVFRLTVDVDTEAGEATKKLDCTKGIKKELQLRGIEIGSSFTLNRSAKGSDGKTTYSITNATRPDGSAQEQVNPEPTIEDVPF